MEDVSSLGRKKRKCATRKSQHSHEEVENAHLTFVLSDLRDNKQWPRRRCQGSS